MTTVSSSKRLLRFQLLLSYQRGNAAYRRTCRQVKGLALICTVGH
jgi:hypothetical protein